MPPKPAQKSKASKPDPKAIGKGPGRKAAAKQPIPLPERLKRLFTSLCAQIDGGHFANAIKTCDKILRLEPNDVDAVKTKLFLLLQTEQYETALALLDQYPEAHRFERAYTLYRLHRESEASAILQEIRAQDSEHRGAAHLEAQLSYREGNYEAAFDTYNQLLDSAEPDSEEQSDILTNLQASQQHLDFVNEGYLRALDGLPTNVNTALESIPPPVPAAPAPGLTSSVNTGADNQQATNPPVKKVRKSRIPPGVIPGVTPPPDPERWLKKSERSTFAHGKRRKGAGGGATQGSAVDPIPQTSSSGPAKSGGKGKKKR
ncbi:hypothetical protein CC1G_14101 [Coprinopsis cinerea okayama7|uniref:Signal recognition particle subunit SRP72 n=1 Tax=Coprinopsis cinerea (strain Okayama-7 / 130 / ATCC MYA-4618 / FGSC 9003) TaxID=240176 RepID=D6RLI3_COPC7|nr:hypothetical protein CC1G_14101 [Coprinopsis cinerea okayama7\|eukprot:XP_002911569.1 hypothetical protein CC1G_14101 [Coprinopsis cinerea okayama7\